MLPKINAKTIPNSLEKEKSILLVLLEKNDLSIRDLIYEVYFNTEFYCNCFPSLKHDFEIHINPEGKPRDKLNDDFKDDIYQRYKGRFGDAKNTFYIEDAEFKPSPSNLLVITSHKHTKGRIIESRFSLNKDNIYEIYKTLMVGLSIDREEDRNACKMIFQRVFSSKLFWNAISSFFQDYLGIEKWKQVTMQIELDDAGSPFYIQPIIPIGLIPLGSDGYLDPSKIDLAIKWCQFIIQMARWSPSACSFLLATIEETKNLKPVTDPTINAIIAQHPQYLLEFIHNACTIKKLNDTIDGKLLIDTIPRLYVGEPSSLITFNLFHMDPFIIRTKPREQKPFEGLSKKQVKK